MSPLLKFRWQDAIDILIVSYLTYRLYLWLRYTKAFQALLGLAFLAVLYLVSRRIDLVATTWLFEELWAVLIILLIILFQSDIHQALSRANPIQILLGAPPAPGAAELAAVARAIFDLAGRRIGALIVFERQNALEGHVLEGTPVEGRLTPELLGTIFYPNSPLHDGAVIVRGGRIRRAGCYLPLAPDADLPMNYGTRHRAALGIAKETDALAVVVSEERGTVALAYDGRIGEVPSAEVLNTRLQDLLTPAPLRHSPIPLLRRPFARLGPKLAVLCFVSLAWYFLVFGQRRIMTIQAPVEYRNLPKGYTMADNTAHVELQIEGTETRLRFLDTRQIKAELDLKDVSAGIHALPITAKYLNLPPGIEVLSITPPAVTVTLDEQVERKVKVRVPLVGRLLRGLKVDKLSPEPDSLKVSGWASEVRRLKDLSTENIDLNSIHLVGDVERILQVKGPPPSLKLAPGEPAAVLVRFSVIRR
ncbi:MAG: adenylate cyclase [Candidatus Latescibacteria bacterium]|nr:adenylate cyclase [Candidatus Latescibacterota bacterium]